MLRRLLLRKVDSYEKQLGESLEYMRYILRHSLGAFLKFARVAPFAGYRKRLPPRRRTSRGWWPPGMRTAVLACRS